MCNCRAVYCWKKLKKKTQKTMHTQQSLQRLLNIIALGCLIFEPMLLDSGNTELNHVGV